MQQPAAPLPTSATTTHHATHHRTRHRTQHHAHAPQESELAELEEELKLALKGKAKEGKKVQAPDAVKARIAKKRGQIDTFKIRAQVGGLAWPMLPRPA